LKGSDEKLRNGCDQRGNRAGRNQRILGKDRQQMTKRFSMDREVSEDAPGQTGGRLMADLSERGKTILGYQGHIEVRSLAIGDWGNAANRMDLEIRMR
jgi:hypothetical protein